MIGSLPLYLYIILGLAGRWDEVCTFRNDWLSSPPPSSLILYVQPSGSVLSAFH